jgi:hypothetical protein
MTAPIAKKKVTVLDVAGKLPDIKPWQTQEFSLFDVFILAAGFEDRAVAVFDLLIENNLLGISTTLILGRYSTHEKENDANLRYIYSVCNKLGVPIVEMNATSTIDTWETLRFRLSQLEKNSRVGFDSSGSSGDLILTTIKAVLTNKESYKFVVFYTAAKSYAPDVDEYNSNKTALIDRLLNDSDESPIKEFGAEAVIAHHLYPGHHQPDVPNFVIVVPSLRPHRMIKCINHIGEQELPAIIDSSVWIIAKDAEVQNSWRGDLLKDVVNRLPEKYSGGSIGPNQKGLNSKTACPTSFGESLGVFFEAIDSNIGKNTYLVHMGAKLHAVAASFALAVRSEVRVISARPKTYVPSAYSSGVGQTFTISFENLADTVENLEKIGTLKVQSGTRGFGNYTPSA